MQWSSKQVLLPILIGTSIGGLYFAALYLFYKDSDQYDPSQKKKRTTVEIREPKKIEATIIGRASGTIKDIARTSTEIIKGTAEQIVDVVYETEDELQQFKNMEEQIQIGQSSRSPQGQALPKNNMVINVSKDQVDLENSSSVQEGTKGVYASTSESPNRSRVQRLRRKARELNDLLMAMTYYYSNNENRELHALNSIAPGDIVATRSDINNSWCRGEIMSDGHEQYSVYFVDYGYSALINAGNILELRTDFLSLPFQATDFSLANRLKTRKDRDAELVAQNYAQNWLMVQAQKSICSEATESTETRLQSLTLDSIRKLRAIVWVVRVGCSKLEDNFAVIRKSSDDYYYIDRNHMDSSMMVSYLRVLPFGVLISNCGSSGEISVKGKPMAQGASLLVTASTNIKVDEWEGYIRIEANPDDVQANIMFASLRYPDIFCKGCKLICLESPAFKEIFQKGEWYGFFTHETCDLQMEAFDKVGKMSPAEIVEARTRYSEYLDEQPEAIELCICNIVVSKFL